MNQDYQRDLPQGLCCQSWMDSCNYYCWYTKNNLHRTETTARYSSKWNWITHKMAKSSPMAWRRNKKNAHRPIIAKVSMANWKTNLTAQPSSTNTPSLWQNAPRSLAKQIRLAMGIKLSLYQTAPMLKLRSANNIHHRTNEQTRLFFRTKFMPAPSDSRTNTIQMGPV